MPLSLFAADTSPILAATLASLMTGLATGVGALPAVVVRRLSPKAEDVMLGFAAGVMLAAAFFSLILPALAAGADQGLGRSSSVLVVIGGVLLGGVALWLIHRWLPHEHFVAGREGPDAKTIRRIWLFVIAITLHNFPEGLAVGVGFGGGDMANGTALAIGLKRHPWGKRWSGFFDVVLHLPVVTPEIVRVRKVELDATSRARSRSRAKAQKV